MIATIALIGASAVKAAVTTTTTEDAVKAAAAKVMEKKTGMTLTIAIILFLQLFCCFGICCWTKSSLNTIAKRKDD